MVHDDGPLGLDGVQVCFDDERVVSDAGIALAATLAARLGIEDLARRFVRLRPDQPGACNAGRKVMSLIFAMALGADSVDDCEVLRSGRTRRLLGGWVAAPSTLGTFLRAFTFGHVRQLDRVLGETLTRAWKAGAGPGEERLVVDVDSFVGEVHGYGKQGASFGYTGKRGYHPILASRAETGEVLHLRLRKGSANTQRGILRFADELIARVTRAGGAGVKLFSRLGVLELQGLRAPRAGRLAVLDRGADDQVRPRGRRADPRGRVAATGRLPRHRRGTDRRNGPGWPAVDRPPRPPARRAGRAVSRLGATSRSPPTAARTSRSSSESIASTRSSSSSSATSRTRRSRTSPRVTSTPTPPGP